MQSRFLKPSTQTTTTSRSRNRSSMSHFFSFSFFPLLVLSILSLSFISLVDSKPSSTGNRLLVVLDSIESKKSYSTFFDDLQSRGYEVQFRASKQVSPELYSHEESQFDHVILMAPTAKSLPSDLSPQSLIKFLKNGGNLMISVSSSLTESYRDLAREFSLEMSERGTSLIDHFRYSTTTQDPNKDHSTILLGPSSDVSGGGLSSGGLIEINEAIFTRETLGLSTTLPIMFKGLTHRIGDLPLAFSILKPGGTAYSAEIGGNSIIDEDSNEIPVLGGQEDVSLISAFQVKDNSARVTWVGSLDLFSDDYLNAKKVKCADGKLYPSTLNGPFLRDLTAWTFQERGVLKVISTHHDRIRNSKDDVRESYEEEGSGKMYRVKDGVTFTIDLSTFDPSLGWIPAPSDLDLQVSLVMLDPYITTSLTSTSISSQNNTLRTIESDLLSTLPSQTDTTTRYTTSFKLPDKHGVFTFVVKWKRNGWSFIETKDTAPVRPFNHDEHPRWLSSAHPYYVGAWSTILGFMVFSTIWILTAGNEMKGKGKKL